MHIILSILGGLTALIFILYRLSIIINTAERTTGVMTRVKRKFFRGGPVHPISEITDIREAVASLLIAIAKADGDLTAAQLDKIQSMLEEDMGGTSSAATELVSLARFNVKDQTDPSMTVSRLFRFISENSNRDQQKDILRMMEDIAALESEISPMQQGAINQLAHHLGIKPGFA